MIFYGHNSRRTFPQIDLKCLLFDFDMSHVHNSGLSKYHSHFESRSKYIPDQHHNGTDSLFSFDSITCYVRVCEYRNAFIPYIQHSVYNNIEHISCSETADIPGRTNCQLRYLRNHSRQRTSSTQSRREAKPKFGVTNENENKKNH